MLIECHLPKEGQQSLPVGIIFLREVSATVECEGPPGRLMPYGIVLPQTPTAREGPVDKSEQNRRLDRSNRAFQSARPSCWLSCLRCIDERDGERLCGKGFSRIAERSIPPRVPQSAKGIAIVRVLKGAPIRLSYCQYGVNASARESGWGTRGRQ
jgi:hypothetical protein